MALKISFFDFAQNLDVEKSYVFDQKSYFFSLKLMLEVINIYNLVQQYIMHITAKFQKILTFILVDNGIFHNSEIF